MPKSVYIGLEQQPHGLARSVTSMYIGVNGVARKIKKAYIGVDGIARQLWPTLNPITLNGGTFDSLAGSGYQVRAASNGKHVVFGPDSNLDGNTISPNNKYTAFDGSGTRTTGTMNYHDGNYGAARAGDYAVMAGLGGSSLWDFSSTTQALSQSLTKTSATAISSDQSWASGSIDGTAIFASGGGNTAYAYNSSLTRTSLSSPGRTFRRATALAKSDSSQYLILAGGSDSKLRKAYNQSLTMVSVPDKKTTTNYTSGASADKYAVFSDFAMNASLTEITVSTGICLQEIKDGYFVELWYRGYPEDSTIPDVIMVNRLFDPSFTAREYTISGGNGFNWSSIERDGAVGAVGNCVFYGGGQYRRESVAGLFSSSDVPIIYWKQDEV